MPVVRSLRSRRGRLGSGLLLLATFLVGMGVTAWHVASADGGRPQALVADDLPRSPAADHHGQSCQICAAAVASLLPALAPVLAAGLEAGRQCVTPVAAEVFALLPVAGPLGSRAPPAILLS